MTYEQEIVETCPYCDEVNQFIWCVHDQGYLATCKICGNPLFLCDECHHTDENGFSCDYHDADCDWHEFPDGTSTCYRMKGMIV